MIAAADLAKISFRDPSGKTLRVDKRVFRLVRCDESPGAPLIDSQAIQKLVGSGAIVGTWKASPKDQARICQMAQVAACDYVVYEHEPIWFPSFPYEWPPEMLYEAAQLTLDLCVELMQEGIGLKDATPFNVLFQGSKPIFVDLLSMEKRDPHDPVWLPYAQFLTTFILPLLAADQSGLNLDQVFLSRREGIRPEDLNRLLSFMQKLKPSNFFSVVLPSWIGSSARSEDESVYRRRTISDPERAAAMYRHVFSALRRKLRRVEPRRDRMSAWANYERNNSYSESEAQKKRKAVEAALQQVKPKTVLDVGCNRGAFSRMAAEAGASVVAIDSDPVVVGQAFLEARRGSLDVLPLVVDISRPTPATGWMNEENPSFLERASKSFDLVLMLAIVHHLIVTERIPTEQILDMVTRLTKDAAVVEFISPADPMFKRLLRGRERLYEHVSESAFEEVCKSRFRSVDRLPISSTRSVFTLRGPNA